MKSNKQKKGFKPSSNKEFFHSVIVTSFVFLIVLFVFCLIGNTGSLFTIQNHNAANLAQTSTGQRSEDEGEVYAEGVNPAGLAAYLEASDSYEINNQVEMILSKMSLEDKCAQLFIVTPETLTDEQISVSEYGQIDKGFQSVPVGGLILFDQNLINMDQTTELLSLANQEGINRTGLPLFLGVDEEGGLVARVADSGILESANSVSADEIAQTGNVEKSYQDGKRVGEYLHFLGFNLDFAPVADVLTNPENPVMKGRTFGSDPELAAELAIAFSDGLLQSGVVSVFKHFPGHGDTANDSHDGYVYSNKTLDELLSCELIPFQKAINQNAPFIMVGHISLPNATGTDTPASLSPELLTDLLRKQMGYQELIITDAMNMGAISNRYNSEDAVIKAIEAGVDVILMPVDFYNDYSALVECVRNGRISEDRIDESLRRIIKVKLALLSNQ